MTRKAAALAAALALGPPGPGLATDVGACAGAEGYREVRPLGETPGLPVRTGPETLAPVVARVAQGAVVRVTDCLSRAGATWLRVETERGTEGWVLSARLGPARATRGTPPEVAGLRGNGTPFDVAGASPCSTVSGGPPRECRFGAIRLARGGAVIWIGEGDRVGGEAERRFVVEAGELVSPAEGARLRRSADRLMIEADGVRYELPAKVLGEPNRMRSNGGAALDAEGGRVRLPTETQPAR